MTPQALRGRWRGGGLHSGHPFDGLLEALGWYGKAFLDDERVHPLLFQSGGRLISLDPRWLPLGLAGWRGLRHPHALRAIRLGLRLVTTDRPTARLRQVAWRGVPSAAMIYDRQPIIDHFREAAPGLLLGLMDLRGQPPMFFTLRAED